MSSETRSQPASAPAAQKQPSLSQWSIPQLMLAASVVAVGLAAVGLAAGMHHMQVVEVPGMQYLQSSFGGLQETILPLIQQHIGQLSGISSRLAQQVRRQTTRKLFHREELSKYTGGGEPGHLQDIYISILGEVFDVTSKPQFYGPGGGYACFAGTDGSKSFITGDFVGDVTDDVSSLDAESCLGLVGWLDFYHKNYIYKGKLIGRFYDQHGRPTSELDSVHQRAKQGEAIKAAREREEQNWPSCNSKWTQEEGGVVWCDDGLYPRKLFVSMRNGKSNWRCACFKEVGWSDVRKVYAECAPDAHRCSTNAEAEKADENTDPTADIAAM